MPAFFLLKAGKNAAENAGTLKNAQGKGEKMSYDLKNSMFFYSCNFSKLS